LADRSHRSTDLLGVVGAGFICKRVASELAAAPAQAADPIQNIIDTAVKGAAPSAHDGVGGAIGGAAGVLLERGAEALGVPPGITSLAGHYLGNGAESLVSAPLAQYNAALDALRKAVAADPEIARQLLSRYQPKFPAPSNYNALAGYAGPAITIAGHAQQEPQVPIR
jgi:hypothetical protein